MILAAGLGLALLLAAPAPPAAAALAPPRRVAPAPARAAARPAPDVDVEVSPRTGEVGLVMAVKVTVTGEQAADCQALDVPVVDGADLRQVAGPTTSQQTFIVNGRVTRSMEVRWDYVLVPRRAGVIELPPFELLCAGEHVASEPVTVPVKSASVPDDAVRLVVQPSTSRLWQGQLFTIEVLAMVDEAWTDRIVQGGMNLTLAWYDGLGGLMRLGDPPSNTRSGHLYLNGGRDPVGAEISRRHDDDRDWLVYRINVPMLAAEAGMVELPGSHFSVSLATEIRRERDPFDFFGGSRAVAARVVEAKATALPVTIDVRAPPLEGRPDSYTNAVGSFQLAAAAAPRTLKVGETCSLSLRLTGTGNLEFVRWPEFTELNKDFRLFGKEEQRDKSSLRLAIEISPKNARVTEIPELKLAVFDTEKEAYEVLTAGPFDLTVSAGGEEGLVELAPREEILNDLETIREALPAPTGEPFAVWLGWLPGLALLLTIETRRRVVGWRAAHPGQVARRGARAALERRLGAARDVRDVAVAFGKFLSDRLGGPPAGLTADEARARLPAGGDDAEGVRRELGEVVARWEAAYLGGRSHDVDAARDEARALARRLEAVT